MNLPRMTLVTTSRHQAHRLEETVRSVLEHGYENLQYLVIDAGGDAHVPRILKQYESRMAWSVSKETWNVARVLNAAFTRATGDILFHLPAGSRLEAGALQRVAAQFSAGTHPWLIGHTRIIENDSARPGVPGPHARPMDWFLDNPIPDGASFIARKLFERAGRFRESLKIAFKYEYWMRLRFAQDIDPSFIDEPLVARIIDGWDDTTDAQTVLAREEKRIRKEYARHLPLSTRLKIVNAIRRRQSEQLCEQAIEAVRARRPRRARRLALASLTRGLSLDALQIAAVGSIGPASTPPESPITTSSARVVDHVQERKKMQVTVVCSMFPPALAPEAAHASLLCRHLADAGCDVTLITSVIDGIRNEPLPYTLRPVMPSWRWSDAPRLLRELRSAKPDVVLLIYLGWIYDRQPMVTFLPTLCRRLKKRPRVVTQFENSQGAEIKLPNQWRAWKAAALLAGRTGIEHRFGTLLRDSDEVITLCEPHLDELTRHFPDLRSKTTIIPAPPLLKIVDDASGATRRDTRARLGYTDDEFVVSYFGYIYPEKGVETVIEAAGLALPAVPKIRLLMIGGVPGNLARRDPKYPQRVRDLAEAKRLADRTFWTGHCEPESDDASSYLHAADAVVLPFTQGVRLNNSSYSVVTSHGLPVITTHGINLEPEFRDRENVMLFAPGDAQAAGQAIVEVATNPALRSALKSGALAYSHGRASWPAVTRQTIEVLRSAGAFATAQPHAQVGATHSPREHSAPAFKPA